jgi:hypothetical protein
MGTAIRNVKHIKGWIIIVIFKLGLKPKYHGDSTAVMFELNILNDMPHSELAIYSLLKGL